MAIIGLSWDLRSIPNLVRLRDFKLLMPQERKLYIPSLFFKASLTTILVQIILLNAQSLQHNNNAQGLINFLAIFKY